ncbi:Nucleoid-associated protein [Campylobacter majalis]|uniref:Nucleoid-associated protein LMG7974_00941 n=1 Tax=Campylobacter majalis TaxID=2790656 RepID=A0ABN7K714_9BACT|nr:YbaB/EbfC family nucleoid-associated protein [Campylobacter majalis]CAD7288318.1 Nucleoid-associated protein [Campylobacter majalis]
MFKDFDFSKMGDILTQVQQKARELDELRESKEYSTKSGGGMIFVKANGKGEIIDINIDDSLLEDKESLQILLISAINDVIKMVADDSKGMAADMLGGMGNFGNFKL